MEEQQEEEEEKVFREKCSNITSNWKDTPVLNIQTLKTAHENLLKKLDSSVYTKAFVFQSQTNPVFRFSLRFVLYHPEKRTSCGAISKVCYQVCSKTIPLQSDSKSEITIDFIPLWEFRQGFIFDSEYTVMFPEGCQGIRMKIDTEKNWFQYSVF